MSTLNPRAVQCIIIIMHSTYVAYICIHTVVISICLPDNRMIKIELELSLMIMIITAQNLKLEWVVMEGYLNFVLAKKLQNQILKLQSKKKQNQLVI